MAISPLGSDPAALRQIPALNGAAGARMATAAPGARTEHRQSADEVFLSGSPPLVEQPPPPPQPAEPPAPALARPMSSHAPAVLMEEMALPEVIDGGGKLDYAQHLQLMGQAAAAGTAGVRTTGPTGISHDIQVHGASAKEMANVQAALQDLGKVDRYDLILHDLKNVYVADTLGTGHGGNPVAGVAVMMQDGETAIVLSRMRGQADRNQLESGNHVREVLYHEIGHVVDNKHNISGLAGDLYGKGDAGKVGAGGDFVSKYAATSYREDYAETFSQFYVGRSSTLFHGCSDQDVVDLTLFGHDGRGAAVEKMRRVPADLGPELHVKDFVGEYCDAHPDVGGARALLRRFYDDGDFRRGFVGEVGQARPGVPHEAVYSYMDGLADLFHEPRGGRPN